jgi:hypothetical protein
MDERERKRAKVEKQLLPGNDGTAEGDELGFLATVWQFINIE